MQTDLARLGAAMRALLAPLDHATVDGWRAAVVRTIGELVGAATGSFVLPLPGLPAVYSDGVSRAVVDAYTSYYHRVDIGLRLRRAQLGLEVWTTAMLWDLAQLRRSEYWNDYKVPNRLYHALGLTMALRDGDATGACADGGAAGARDGECASGHPAPMYAGFFFHHDRPSARFSAREQALLELLQPATRASIQTLLRLGEWRTRLAAQLDRCPEGYLVCDLGGRVLHRNPALERLLAGDTERERVRGTMEQLAFRLARLARGDADAAFPDPASSLTLPTTRARYRITATYLGASLLAPMPAIAVALERHGDEQPPVAIDATRLRLTPREVDVTRLLAQGKSNAEIARALTISPHTAHHHTERVLGKLGVRSRARVLAALLAVHPHAPLARALGEGVHPSHRRGPFPELADGRPNRAAGSGAGNDPPGRTGRDALRPRPGSGSAAPATFREA